MTSAVAPEEDVRIRCGLSRTQWDALAHPEDNDVAFTTKEIGDTYDLFLADLQAKVDRAFRQPAFTIKGVAHLSTVQAAQALGVGEFHLSTMRSRGKLRGEKFGRRTIYSRDDLDRFLTHSEVETERKSALALAFTRLMERKRQN